VTACVFDLDGVLTASSAPHAAAWQETFDASRRICFAFDGSRRFLELAREADLRCAVVSAGPNTRAILERSGLLDLVDEVIDSDDSVLGACRRLQVHPPNVAAFESTGAGVVAGRAAGVSCVIGVDRAGHVGALVEHGADRVVGDLAELIDPMLAA
jgi:beta-phosphoglucomutase-like phosphatase (HAD superfamily)